MSITFTRVSPALSVTVVAIPGTIQRPNADDVRGGGNLVSVKAGLAKDFTFQCNIEATGDQSLATLKTLQINSGSGDIDVTGDIVSNNALMTLVQGGDGSEIMTVTGQGTIPTP